MSRVDVDALRAAHPIEQVVAASGVELRRSGKAYMARCPFHAEDRNPSMSVGGVSGRYHCFACGVGGDVIDYVARFNRIGFREAADRLDAGDAFGRAVPVPVPMPRRTGAGPHLDRTSASRLFDINALAWRHFTEPANVAEAERYMLTQRRIDIRAIRSVTDGRPLVGYAPNQCRHLARALMYEGVTAGELADANLAHHRDGRIIDTLRGRVIFPVSDPFGRIEGFIGRDTTGHPRAAKYRNPTRTATFDKARALYRPTRHQLDPDAQAVVVEGVTDALAITAAAARSGSLSRFAPCTTSGVSVSRTQALKVQAITRKPVLVALDGDDAGEAGTNRWLHAFDRLGVRATSVALPQQFDPADWLAVHGFNGLNLFDQIREGGLAEIAQESRLNVEPVLGPML